MVVLAGCVLMGYIDRASHHSLPVFERVCWNAVRKDLKALRFPDRPPGDIYIVRKWVKRVKRVRMRVQ